MDSREALVGLNMIEHVGPVRVRQLLEHFGEIVEVIEWLHDQPWIDTTSGTICSDLPGFSSSVPQNRLSPTEETTFWEPIDEHIAH